VHFRSIAHLDSDGLPSQLVACFPEFQAFLLATHPANDYAVRMRSVLLTAAFWLIVAVCAQVLQADSKRHVVVFGKPVVVKLFAGNDETKPLDLKVRPLYVDGKLKEFTTGDTHDITDQQFAVQRAFRVNDSLPGDDRNLPKWRWQRGGWMLVDRTAGRVTALHLPNFDSYYSEVAWYRDYAAYCGVSDNGEKLYAVVTQVGIHKPVLLNLLRPLGGGDPESECGRPMWQREPVRVTFDLKDGQKLTYTVRGRATDLSPPEATEAEEEPN